MRKYIDRAALFNSLSDAKTIEEIFAAIQEAPAADVQEVRHGRWEDEVYTSWPLKIYGHKCSVCRAITPVSEGKNNYCPNCGARMEGDE